MARPHRRKSGVYIFRRRIPSDIPPYLVDHRREIVESLDTKDVKTAQTRFREAEAKYEAIWNSYRARPVDLSGQQISAVAGELYRSLLRRVNHGEVIEKYGNRAMLNGLNEGLGLDPSKSEHVQVDRVYPQALEDVLETWIDGVLHRLNLRISERSRGDLLIPAAKAALQAAEKVEDEWDGNFQPDPKANRFALLETLDGLSGRALAGEKDMADRPARGLSLAAALKCVDGEWAPNTRKRWIPIITGLVKFANATNDVWAITREDVKNWRDHTLENDFEGKPSPITFKRNHLAAIKRFFSLLASAKDLKIENPATGSFVKSASGISQKDMRALTEDEAKTILRAAVGQFPKRWSTHRAVATRWVPWICAYTGARINELTQVRRKDIRKIDGYWCVHITPEAGTEKTDTARNVPLHPHLIDQGFLNFCSKFEDEDRLFAAEHGKGKTAPAEIAGGKLAKWIRDLGIDDPTVSPNHGWRHRFKTCYVPIIEEAYADAIQGHAPKTQGRKYNKFPVAELGRRIFLIPRIEIT